MPEVRSINIAAGSTILLLAGLLAGCDGSVTETEALETSPFYAVAVEEFNPGEGSGFGLKDFPGVVLGEPDGKGPNAGGLDVLSLGAGGEIILSFGDATMANGQGPDFAVYENAFYVGGDPNKVFAELAEVSVSQNGTDWVTFSCNPDLEGPVWPGCAGGTPTLPCTEAPDSVHLIDCGGDLFDLEDVGLDSANYVRIRDLSQDSSGNTAGFDLDAVGLLYWR